MTPTLRVAIVDDEPPARALLRDYLQAHPDVEIVAECANGFEAVKILDSVRADLVLLDVQMPKLDGFEVLELLAPGPLVVFVTAYDEFALRAFEVSAVDYLLKPLGRDRLAAALDRVRQRRGSASPVGDGPAQPGSEAASRLVASRRGPGRFLDRIVVKDGPHVHVVPVDRIDVLEAQDDYVAIYADGKVHLKTQPLAELSSALDPARFVQVHRSYTVNVDRIARIELVAKDRRIAILHDGREIPVSRTGYARLRA